MIFEFIEIFWKKVLETQTLILPFFNSEVKETKAQIR